jgi:magnesium transporter
VIDAHGSAGAWVEVVAPDEAECARLVADYGLHELAIEDALRIGHPPKLEDFGDYLFLIVHTPDLDGDIGTRKVALFLRKDRLVTILRAPLPPMDAIRGRVERDQARYLGQPAVLAHAILDNLTDGFEQLVDRLADRIETVEEGVGRPETLEPLAGLRSEASELARTLRTQRDVLAALARGDHAFLSAKLRPYMRDLYDHVLRVCDLLEGLRERIHDVRDTHLALVNTRLAETMRILTVIATIMMPLGVIAGVYGMNFEAMPGARNPVGFWVTVAAMIATASGMYIWIRRISRP